MLEFIQTKYSIQQLILALDVMQPHILALDVMQFHILALDVMQFHILALDVMQLLGSRNYFQSCFGKHSSLHVCSSSLFFGQREDGWIV